MLAALWGGIELVQEVDRLLADVLIVHERATARAVIVGRAIVTASYAEQGQNDQNDYEQVTQFHLIIHSSGDCHHLPALESTGMTLVSPLIVTLSGWRATGYNLIVITEKRARGLFFVENRVILRFHSFPSCEVAILKT